MEQLSTISLAQQNDPNDPLTLEEAKDRIVVLLKDIDANAWNIGDVLNKMTKRGLALGSGYGTTRTWLEAEIPETRQKTSTLYNYAKVASRFTKPDVEAWGIKRLLYLYNYDRKVVGRRVEGDPGQREVQLVQEDGSTLAKKFRDCTTRDFARSNQLRKEGQKKGRKKERESTAAIAKANGDSLQTGPKKERKTKAASGDEVHWVRRALVGIALGALLTALAGLLADSVISGWLFLAGGGLALGGVGLVVRHWHVAWELLVRLFKRGDGINLLKAPWTKARRLGLKLSAAVRPKPKSELPAQTVDPASAPDHSPTPSEKKAA